MVLGRLTYFLEYHNIFSTVLAGFRPGRSTVDQVLSQSIADSFHQSKPGTLTDLATLDFAKAFDSVWHSALLSLGLPLSFVKWIRSYLLDRRSKVRICNSHSCPFRLRRGVSQGSVLDQSSSLFLLIIYLPFFLHSLKPFFLHSLKSLSMQTILLFGPFCQMLNVQLPLFKLPVTD